MTKLVTFARTDVGDYVYEETCKSCGGSDILLHNVIVTSVGMVAESVKCKQCGELREMRLVKPDSKN